MTLLDLDFEEMKTYGVHRVVFQTEVAVNNLGWIVIILTSMERNSEILMNCMKKVLTYSCRLA